MSESSPERILWTDRPSFWNWWPRLMIGDLSLALIAALWWVGETTWIAPAAGLAVVAYLSAAAARWSVRYTLTDQRVISRTGLFSKRVDEVEIGDIRNIVLEQSFTDRICGIGTVGMSSAGGDGIEVRFDGIKNPDAFKERVRRVRLNAAKSPSPEETAHE